MWSGVDLGLISVKVRGGFSIIDQSQFHYSNFHGKIWFQPSFWNIIYLLEKRLKFVIGYLTFLFFEYLKYFFNIFNKV